MYNPFDKKIEEINESDLSILIENEICEGWYIEYKREIPKTNNRKLDSIKIAKSISSFANTKGGWIFWGVSCNSKNTPESIDGVCISDYRNIDDQISQIINSNISPQPIYNLSKVALANNNTVIIIQVIEGPTPPYITGQGIIYQRENNESKPIKDRYIIEKLNEKTTDYYESIERFCNFDLAETKGQSDWNQTYLELYLFPTPFDNFEFKDFYSSQFFKNVASRFYQNIKVDFSEEDPDNNFQAEINLGFNSIYSSEGSLIIRPINEHNLIYKSTTVELFENGNLKFLIPLVEFTTKNIPEAYVHSNTINYLLDKYSPFETVEQFESGFYPGSQDYQLPPITRRSSTDFVNHIKFIDGAELILRILIIVSKYKSILSDNEFDFNTEIGFRAKITDCWRKFIFFDDDNYLEKIKLYNIPLSPKNDIEIPEFRKGNAYTTDLSKEGAYFLISKFIMEGIGLPDSQDINYVKIITQALRKIRDQQNYT